MIVCHKEIRECLGSRTKQLMSLPGTECQDGVRPGQVPSKVVSFGERHHFERKAFAEIAVRYQSVDRQRTKLANVPLY